MDYYLVHCDLIMNWDQQVICAHSWLKYFKIIVQLLLHALALNQREKGVQHNKVL